MAETLDLLTEPLGYGFIVRGMAAAMLVGVVSSVVGSFVVVRGMAFFGDALAHAILPGVAVGYVIGGGQDNAMFWGGLAAAVLAGLGIGAISSGGRLKEDTAIGVIFAAMFALGIAIISRQQGYAVDLSHILFGDVLGVSSDDLVLVAVVGSAVILIVALLFKEFVLLSFDPVQARTLRLPVTTLHNLLLVLIAVTIVVSLQTVGIALMVAMLVTPAATASLVTRRLAPMMLIGSVIGAVSGAVGLYGSYYFGVASGAAIVLVCSAIFGVVLVATRRR